ncbi:MAG: RecX family transcriptional regulator [Bacteroidetes bacterium]|nr:MAG: RecX family transcriptional regulator [Bacteroidota bacterium]RLD82089.1 MAG: RecX family transcriptional regulator [Bacteroidota bacterium]
MIKKQITPEQALIKTQNICASQEKCKADIRKKLYDWKIPAMEIEKILKKLVEDKFIDENRYAGFYVKDKYKLNKWGRIKIEFSLRQKQIEQSLITNAVNEINDDEYKEIFRNELIKKLKSLRNEESHKLKEKLLRFAQGRGYEAELSILMVGELLDKSNLALN